mgnify:CR=1 FL=1
MKGCNFYNVLIQICDSISTEPHKMHSLYDRNFIMKICINITEKKK